jgi:hypothetical protein
MIIEMTTRIEIMEGEAVAGVEIDTPVTGTEIGITAVVAAVAATVLMITRGVAETAHHLQVGALRHKHNSLAKHLEQLRMNGLALILCVATHLLDGGLFSVKVV